MAEEKKESDNTAKWSWYSFVYCLAQGDVTKIEAIFEMNFVFILNHKSFELENKKIKEWYDWRRFNVEARVEK